MLYDDLPLWGFIGKVEKILRSGEKPDLKLYLFTHIHFEVLYNANRVVEITISADPARTVDITEGGNIIVDYTYSVKWKSTDTLYERRMDKYSQYSFLPQHLEVSLQPTHICMDVLCIVGELEWDLDINSNNCIMLAELLIHDHNATHAFGVQHLNPQNAPSSDGLMPSRLQLIALHMLSAHELHAGKSAPLLAS